MFLGDKERRLTLLLLVLAALFLWLAGCSAGNTSKEIRSEAPNPDQERQLEQLNKTADELYQAATTGSLVKARDILNRFGDQTASAAFGGVTTVEGVGALTNAVIDAKREFNAVRINPERAIKMAARLKLAADALTHRNEPMWLQYYKVLSEDTNRFEQSVLSGKASEARTRLGELKDHYDTIRPSVWISRPPEEGERMDSLLTFFTRQTESGQLQLDILKPGIGQWKEALDSLFRKSGDRTAYLPVIQPDKPVLWTLTVGSLIAAVLVFTAWRMFRWDRSRIRSSRSRRADGE